MYKKVFTILLLAVFMLAQFSMASAAPTPAQGVGKVTLEPLPTFNSWSEAELTYTVSGMETGAKKYLLAWSRLATTPVSPWNNCQEIMLVDASVINLNGSYTYLGPWNDQDIVEFYVTVESDDCMSVNTVPPIDDTPAMTTTYIDTKAPYGFMANPPSLSALAFSKQPVACNTFEMWALATDYDSFLPQEFYSGMAPWIRETTGTFASPAPEGENDSLFSWVQTFPSTASGVWSFSVAASDVAGNSWVPAYFRDPASAPVSDTEREDCKNFTDTAGREDEVYIRYLATLGLISGFADGSFGPDNTLTRAEAATLFETSNGYDATSLPTSAPAGCDFSDVAASDWFAGWVWQACDDGFMNGVGGGLFDPNNTLTRGQVVTIFNNIHEKKSGVVGSYLEPWTGGYATVLGYNWKGDPYRIAEFTDVPVGAYYAIPVQKAYGVGVADGTSETTFSPDQVILRGEFAKMLYRALSRWN